MEKEGDFIKWFSELNKNSIDIVGGKGANLAEIYNLKVPVPLGFVVTTKAYDYFLDKAKLKSKISYILGKINYENTKELDGFAKDIRNLIIDADMPKDLQEEIISAYDILSTESMQIKNVDEIIKEPKEKIFVAVRSSATAEDLADASFAGQQDTFVNVSGNKELIEKVKRCFASLFTARAVYYRNKKDYKKDAKLAVVVQKMVNSDKSGVIFSKDPSYKNENIIIEAVFGLGEGIVSGKIVPDKYLLSKNFEILDEKIADKKTAIVKSGKNDSVEIKLEEKKSKSKVLKDSEIFELAKLAIKLEKHYKKAQDIEFAIEKDKIYLVQTRAITTLEKRTDEKKIQIKGQIVLSGNAASPGIASGKIKIVKDMRDLPKVNQGDVLITKMTNPDMVVTMQKVSAIVTDEGGITSHAAIVSREMGIPCVVGTRDATRILKENEIITVDGFSGKVYKGKVSQDMKQEVQKISEKTKTKIKVTIDLPKFAERASKTGLKDVGLLRLEGIIAESRKHPNHFVKNKKFKEYEEIIFKGLKEISKYFDKIWVRTSDVRSDEFRNLQDAQKEIEINPMLGMHGIRYSLKNPEILKAEINALKRISNGKKVGLMMPQIVSVQEVIEVKKILKEMNFSNVELGVMVETPAAVQIIEELCKEKIHFISFGTNDLTQYTLAIDRGNSLVQEMYNEMHPSVLKQIEKVIKVCKNHKVETSICGQAANKKEMVKFLVKKGIDSISVNPDSAKEISEFVASLEKK